ncbi:Card1-like endonuclease domain-containing protein [Parabacteroides goldsteinii]|uniref:Card1-like endonuclease domain-containing protein n=1 Tax=Parabacteroides goldsteinii TaxID=328812 RepID=UPI001899F441|nr:DUF1887 family CARF protein [Parabacteroides goldsteinii]
MAKIHITLVGGQPAPVYHGIVATKPDKVVFIYSDESRDVVDTLRNEINIPEDEQQPLEPTDPIKILRRAEALAKKYAEDEVTMNISSGLKSWSHLFGITFDKQPNASVVYMDQNNVLWNYRTMQLVSDFEFDMHTLFRLYGNSLENNYRKLSDYTEEDDRAVEKIEKIRLFNVKSFTALVALLDKGKGHQLKYSSMGRFQLEDERNFVEWSRKGNEQPHDRVVLSLFHNKKGQRKWEMVSPNAINLVFNSGWFEYKVAKLLSKWDKAKEICLNCRFSFKQNLDKNETDIIVNTGTKLLFVECKTQIKKTTDIDKFRSVVKTYGGMGSKGLFVTEAKMDDVARAKCMENAILSFSFADVENGNLQSEKALALLLDHELFNINTK